MPSTVIIWGVITKIANKMVDCSPLFNSLYDEELEEIPSYRKYKKKYKKEVEKSKPFMNIREDDHRDGRYMDKSFYRMRTAMLKYSKKLCNSNTTMRSLARDTSLKCHMLHYQNPYLKIGPFKYEPLNDDPHIGMFKDFYSFQHLDDLVTNSKEQLFSSSFYVSEKFMNSLRSELITYEYYFFSCLGWKPSSVLHFPGKT